MPTARELLTRVASFCRDEFGNQSQRNRCLGAFTKRPQSGDDTRRRLLCAASGETPEEGEECDELVIVPPTFDEARGLVARRFPTTVSAADDFLRKVEPFVREWETVLAGVEPRGRRLGRPVPTGVERAKRRPGEVPLAPAPEVAPPPRDVAQEIREGLGGPRLSPLQITNFPIAVQECLKQGEPGGILEPLIGVVVDVDRRLDREEQKLEELCHQLEDAALHADSPEIRRMRECLACPEEPISLLRALAVGT